MLPAGGERGGETRAHAGPHAALVLRCGSQCSRGAALHAHCGPGAPTASERLGGFQMPHRQSLRVTESHPHRDPELQLSAPV